MDKSLTDTSAPKGFVTAIWQKLFGSRNSAQDQEKSAVLAALLSALRKRTENGSKPSIVVKAKLAEFVLPAVFKPSNIPGAGSGLEVDHKQAKLWAFACGEMIGMLAGLSIQESKMSGAIDQVSDEARDTAKFIHESVMKLAKQQGVTIKEEKPEAAPVQSKSSANAERTKMMGDLEMQIMLETSPEGKAALQSMLDRMKKEASLEDAA